MSPAPARSDHAGLSPQVKPQVAAAATMFLILVLLVGLPLRRDRIEHRNPTADAETTCEVFLARIDGTAIPSLTPEGSDVTARRRLTRDLSAPDRWRPVEAAGSVRPARKAARLVLPALSGVLVDGASRKAMIGGKLAACGDVIDGYRVVEIESGCVILEKSGARHRVFMKGTQ
jgi:hypothetical protein